jgi:hypothetical protein
MTDNIIAAYNDGFKSGLNWPDAWMNDAAPGGPWVPYGYDAKTNAAAIVARAENEAWRNGWKAGLTEKVASGRINPFRGTDKNAAFHAGK